MKRFLNARSAAAGLALGCLSFAAANCSSSSNSGSGDPSAITYSPPAMGGGTGGGGGSIPRPPPFADAGLSVAVAQTILVVDTLDAGYWTNPAGMAPPRVDPSLVNPWGLATTPAQTIWVNKNGSGLSSAFNAAGMDVIPAVSIPAPPGSDAGTASAPTGIVWNADATRFMGDTFIFVTEDGTIAGWQSGTAAVIRVNNSATEAIYKGVTIVGDRLFAANFHSGEVEVYDKSYQRVGAFRDPNVEADFAPFNVANVDGTLYVTFAKQDENKEDDVKAPGNGFIDTFDPATGNAQRLVSNGALNSPWAVTRAPQTFGAAAGMLLVGNFGDGKISIYQPDSGTLMGALTAADGGELTVDGLWGLTFGMEQDGGTNNTLYFSAGPGDEQHGVFGTFTPSTP